MRKWTFAFVFILVSCPTMAGAQAAFGFYGIRSGMEREQVKNIFFFASEYGTHKAANPRHGLSELFFGFDHKERLYFIEAYYDLPRNAEKKEALMAALREKFEEPIKQRYKDVEIKLDIYTSSQGLSHIVMSLKSRPLRNEYISHSKGEFVKEFQ